METRYPIRKADGTEYQRYEDVKGKLGNEQVGKWLVANNYLWHGGIHISRASAPNSVLTEETAERAIPLQCMAGGDIVALRVNAEYKEAPYGEDQKINYSSTFVLVRSTHTPDSNKPNSALTFYTLYMHLAPLSDYPERSISLVIERSGLKKRTVTGHEIEGQATSDATNETFLKGTLVEVGRTLSFTHNGARKDFCTARKIENGKPVGDYFWVAAGEENLQPQSKQRAYLPDWMQEAVKTGTYDSVIIPATTIKISAGSPIGFLGRDDAPNVRDEVQADWQSHIEVFSNDSKMPRFLSNPENVTSNVKGYIKAKEGASIYQRTNVDNVMSFTRTEETVSKEETWRVVEPEQSTPFEDAEGKWWFQFDNNIWLSQDDVDELDPCDLIGRNFYPLEQPSTGDFSKTLVEPWVSKAFRWLGSTRKPAEGDFSRWDAAASLIDLYSGGTIQNMVFHHFRDNLFNRLHSTEDRAPDLRDRLIVKHDSEWYGKSDEPCWKKILDECGDKERPWLTQWRDDVEWMSQVEGFKEKAQRQLWHFHPLEFLAGIGKKEFLIDVDAFVEEYKKVHSSFSVAGVFTEASENNLRLLAENINIYYSDGCEYKPNLYKLAYMFATARHETFLFDHHPAEFFRSGPEVGKIRYFDRYDPVLAPEEYQRKKAIKNGNVNRGDGYKYRGRGLVHLTWHDNYKKAGDKVGVDLVANPDLAMDINNSVPIMVWGMEEGIFTGVGINRFIYSGKIDYLNARKVINGTDRALLVSEYAVKFQSILEKTSAAPKEFQ